MKVLTTSRPDSLARQPAAALPNVRAAENGQAKSIRHALRTLLILADARRPLGVTELADKLGLHKSSASRILATLRVEKFVDRESESGRYQLGLGILSLAGVVLGKYRLPACARQQLELLAENTGETVTVSGWNGREAVNVDQILGSRSVAHYSPPGRVNPVHCTSTGKVFLACSDESVIDAALAGPLARHTQRTIVSTSALRQELAVVRERGFAIADREFLDDVSSIAAPVFDQNGSVWYVIALTLPFARFCSAGAKKYPELLLEVSRELSVRNGFNPLIGGSSANW